MADCRFYHTSPGEMGERICVQVRHGNPWLKTCQPICQTKEFSFNNHNYMLMNEFNTFLLIVSLCKLTKLCLIYYVVENSKNVKS